MQYSYENWLNEQPKTPIMETAADSAVSVAEEPSAQSFPFTEDLRVLEKGLSLGLDEGLQVYRQHQHLQTGLWREEGLKPSDETHWEDLAKLVADHVLAYMLDNPLQNELQDVKSQNKAYYKDNLAMAQQVRKLVDENDTLRSALGKAEKELASYHKLAGGFYVKQ